ncbi:MAG: PIG-L family deacetylase, partial [bacterium]
MTFALPEAEFFIPDGMTETAALRRTTHLGVGAHQDDLEIMAWHGILTCFDSDTDWFTGVTVTDGGGSARTGPYASTTDAEMRLIRRAEQRKASVLGEYSAMIQLCHPSATAKNPSDGTMIEDFKAILAAARPRVVYTHNLADKHDTHVALALKLVKAVRQLPPADRPERLYGCEVWRNLDWMLDEDKVKVWDDLRKKL